MCFLSKLKPGTKSLKTTSTKKRRSSHRWCSVKKLFLEISQNSQESPCVKVSFLIKLLARSATLLKRRLWHRCFSVNFGKFLVTTFLQNTSDGCFWRRSRLIASLRDYIKRLRRNLRVNCVIISYG